MEDKVKELIFKMQELGVSESDLLKGINALGMEIAGKPADKTAFINKVSKIRADIKELTLEVFKDGYEIDKEIFDEVIGYGVFKEEFRELADSEMVRLVKFHDDAKQKIALAESKDDAREIFLSLMISYEDVVYGNIGLFKEVDYNLVLRFAEEIGIARSAIYKDILETVNACNLVDIKNDDIEKAKTDILGVLSKILTTDVNNGFSEDEIKELTRLSSLKNIELGEIKTSDDVFIRYGVLVSMLVLYGLTKKRIVFKMALSELKFELGSMMEEN